MKREGEREWERAGKGEDPCEYQGEKLSYVRDKRCIYIKGLNDEATCVK